MKRIFSLILLFALSASLLIGLSGCGKKGPLYLEKDQQQKP
jgi:predicted small lipoprotein YifL